MSDQFNSITVEQLQQLLSDYDPNTLVTFSSNYGDRSRTEQVHSLEGYADMKPLTKTAYSDSGYAIADDDEEEAQTVLVIS